MFNLKENTPIDMLRQFAVYLNADLIENLGAAKLVLDNEKGKGTISIYEVFPGLTAWVYKITYTENFKIEFDFSTSTQYYFGYHQSGYQLQKFSNEKELKKIHEGQNFILSGETGQNSEFTIPSNINYESCYLIINPSLFKKYKTNLRVQLVSNLKQLFKKSSKEESYRYFGNINLHTGEFVKMIISNSRIDLVGRLTVEGAILNMLASQIESFQNDKNNSVSPTDFSQEDISAIIKLGDYIRKNISNTIDISTLCKYLGFNEKKIQKGVRYVYGTTVNEYITSIRMELAKEFIQSTDMTISQVCYSIGYSSRSYFSNVFRKRFGILPRDYKNSFSKGEFLFEVSYRSLAVLELKEEDVVNIIDVSKIQNKNNNITGSLIFHNNIFFQLIEGPKKEVLQLYKNIKKDNRHHSIVTLWQGPKPKLEFEDWSMAMISNNPMIDSSTNFDINELNLSHLVSDLNDKAILSDKLWRRVRNKLKISR
ncbi:BLUF domain-containing protein [uncultured Dokdonia sp.]|uniref:BLUF domain-containing protein n=1 Tax=uncultured Dokdonia sp. TaxID=575653 RepID=UPI00260EE409|nr:BLUF domain-containing protein [uncultured Dokdonia sp.]